MKGGRFDPGPTLARLKDFQRRTVDYVFDRLYGEGGTRRFLVADEVGLGKTLVAAGVIARALEHLHDKVERIDVIYVCSNAAIAKQNIDRLNVVGGDRFSFATRLTLLPQQIGDIESNPINFVSFTPGTTFDLKSHTGRAEERVLLYHMLRTEPWARPKALGRLLRCWVSAESWRHRIASPCPFSDDLAGKFRLALQRSPVLADLLRAMDAFERGGDRSYSEERDPRRVVGDLRRLLASVCVDALEPDLIILDEFQRFRNLLQSDSDEGQLAEELFRYQDARLLLLSATPYKAVTLDDETEDDHYRDFCQTLGFLLDDAAELEATRRDLRAYRRAVLSVEARGSAEAEETIDQLRRRLGKVMCRTERVSMTANRDAMLAEPQCCARLEPRDLLHAAVTDRAVQALGARDAMEYWKSSPYALNLLGGYDLRRRLDDAADDPPEELLRALRQGAGHLLSRADVESYRALDPGNGRMRSLFADTLDRGLWRLLWMPPSLPYSEPAGAYAEVGDVTKALVFSSWRAVPRAISMLASYEAERRMVAKKKWRYDEVHDRLTPRLQFRRDKRSRLAGMPALALLYPSARLAAAVDPLAIALEAGGGRPVPRRDLLDRAERTVAELLRGVVSRRGAAGAEDERWYWAAPALLDAAAGASALAFCAAPGGWRAATASGAAEDEATGFVEHLDALAATMRGEVALGAPPRDLARVVAELALGGPGTCALRALGRIAPELDLGDPRLLAAAARVAEGFRTLGNLPETIALLRPGRRAGPYWQRLVSHGIDGNLQAVLDEQVHMLVDALGQRPAPPAVRAAEVADALADALAIRTAPITIDELKPHPRQGRIEIKPLRVRCRFALRFDELKDEQERTLARADTVRQAFNSPFRPFVLASTSIGQEGLDFHTWCHAVVHWNLPSNPVDLEQREGRVQRFKGHAVRKNVARAFGLPGLAAWSRRGDPWDHLFDLARQSRPPDATDLVPYWLYELDGGARIERRVPMLPLSREVTRLGALKRSLAVYRLALGQPRQEDLLEFLGRVGNGDGHPLFVPYRIGMEP